jgi:peptide/nickel transport system permease protein
MESLKKTKLDNKMDIIKRKEEAGFLENKSQNRALRRFLSNKLAVIGLIISIIILFAAIFAPIICKYYPQTIDILNRLQPPSSEHIFGTDKIGRDVFARVLYGGRISIFIGIGSALGVAIVGVLLGTYAGYKGGLIDEIIMRISEIMMSFPQIVLVLLVVSIVGQSLWNLILIFILTGWGSLYRITRAKMLSIREEEYVLALKAFGSNDILICYKHMLPNALSPILVNITLNTAMFILQEAALSFLGLGVPLNIPTWGNILNVAQDFSVLKENWWIWLSVGSLISLFVMSVNFVGDGLRDSLDPTQQE